MTKKWHHHDPNGVQLKTPFYLLNYLRTYLLTYLLSHLHAWTYSLTPWSRVLLEKLTSSQLVTKFYAFYGTRKFITTFTSARSLSYSSEAFVNGSFHDTYLYNEDMLTPRPTPKLEEHPLSPVRHCLFSIFAATLHIEARGGAVGWGTALQAGRSRVRFPMVSLDSFIDIILQAALWPWGWLSL